MNWIATLVTIWLFMAIGFRYLCARHFVDSWTALCATYIALKRAPAELTQDDYDEMVRIAACWSIYQIMSHIWIWDFSRFVVDGDEMHKVLDFYLDSGKMKGDESS